jgi:hypothetical protein
MYQFKLQLDVPFVNEVCIIYSLILLFILNVIRISVVRAKLFCLRRDNAANCDTAAAFHFSSLFMTIKRTVFENTSEKNSHRF